MKTKEELAHDAFVKRWPDWDPIGEGYAHFINTFLAGYTAANQWVPVGERLPEEGEECFFTSVTVKDWQGTLLKPMISFGFYRQGYFYSYIDVRDRWSPTHYIAVSSLPLPEPPTN